jgi:hypothetical protein
MLMSEEFPLSEGDEIPWAIDQVASGPVGKQVAQMS